MIRFLLRLGAAWAAEKACRRVVPPKRYVYPPAYVDRSGWIVIPTPVEGLRVAFGKAS